MHVAAPRPHFLTPAPRTPWHPYPMQGPTVSPVYTRGTSGEAEQHLFAAVICVPKKQIYPAVKEIRRVGAPPRSRG